MKHAIMKFAVAILGATALCQLSHAGTTTYKYDALGRVSTVTDGGAVIRYVYDAAGNRKDKIAQGGVATTLSLQPAAIERRGSVVLSVTVGGTSARMPTSRAIWARPVESPRNTAPRRESRAS
jgi:YD repeat-containing protein